MMDEAKQARELMEYVGEDFPALTSERIREVRAALDVETMRSVNGVETPETVVLSYPELYELLRSYEATLGDGWIARLLRWLAR